MILQISKVFALAYAGYARRAMPMKSFALASFLSANLAVFATLGCGGSPPPPTTSSALVSAAPMSAPTTSATPVGSPQSAPFTNRGGMWLPTQIPSRAKELQQLGLAVDPALLADPKSSLLGAVVNLNGCSASFVSKDGLVITNHHCATAALQRNSSPTEDLLADGMLAKARSEERTSGPSARLNVLSKMTEVTAEIRPALLAINDDLARKLALERLEKQTVANCERGRPGIRCGLVSMYAGLHYFTVESLEIRDVRIVYAPPAGIGNYGGEVDNWRWPRHSGDVAFFRAYVGKDGLPADYSPNNVPYQPSAFLKLASTPLVEGDLVLVAGYPGHTSLLAPAAEMRLAEFTTYPEQLAMFDAYLAMFAELSKGDPEVAIKATGRRRGFDNYRTKHLGELDGMKRFALLDQKVAQEKAIQAFIDADPERVAAYGTVLADIEQAYAERELTRATDTALESEYLMPRLIFAAYRVARMADERQKPDAERDPEYQERNLPRLRDELKAIAASYNPKLDRAMLKLALQRDRARDPQHRTPALALVAGKDPSDSALDSALSRLYDSTRLADEKFRLNLFDHARFAELARHPDALVRLAAKLYPAFTAARDRRKRFDGKLLLLHPRYLEALLTYEGGRVAPDANSTLRIAYGTVQKAPANEPGASIGAFTSVAQVVAKNTGKVPFNAPENLLAAARTSPQSPYADAALGDVPVDFLSDVHITNGNSGSATLNARGELVGLAFDGTYESVASDWLFLPNTRSIHVDLRYVLFLLHDVDHAQALLSELGVAQ